MSRANTNIGDQAITPKTRPKRTRTPTSCMGANIQRLAERIFAEKNAFSSRRCSSIQKYTSRPVVVSINFWPRSLNAKEPMALFDTKSAYMRSRARLRCATLPVGRCFSARWSFAQSRACSLSTASSHSSALCLSLSSRAREERVLGLCFFLFSGPLCLVAMERDTRGGTRHFTRCCVVRPWDCCAVPIRERLKNDSILPHVLCSFKELKVYQTRQRGRVYLLGADSFASGVANVKR
jgi:hypothetical protein